MRKMKKEGLDITRALSYLRGGYKLTDGRDVFLLSNHIVTAQGEGKRTRMDIILFQELYKDSQFYVLDESNEDIVDPEKDKEYYSFRQ